MILSGALMLRHLGELDAAVKVERAVEDVIGEGKYVTYDLRPDRDPGKAVGTSQMADALIERVKS
jgi:isocitrate dehydrogenase (NAD+)